jgi:hypothetical protein
VYHLYFPQSIRGFLHIVPHLYMYIYWPMATTCIYELHISKHDIRVLGYFFPHTQLMLRSNLMLMPPPSPSWLAVAVSVAASCAATILLLAGRRCLLSLPSQFLSLSIRLASPTSGLYVANLRMPKVKPCRRPPGCPPLPPNTSPTGLHVPDRPHPTTVLHV